MDGPEILTENPLIKTLLHLLGILRYDWRKEDVLAFLKSSYTAPQKIEADWLRRRASAAGVRSGREHWQKLLHTENLMESSVLESLHLVTHYDALLTKERVSPIEFAEWIKEIIIAFGLEERIATGEPTRGPTIRSGTKFRTSRVMRSVAATRSRGSS